MRTNLKLLLIGIKRRWYSAKARYYRHKGNAIRSELGQSALKCFYWIHFTIVFFGAFVSYLFVTGSLVMAIDYTKINAELMVHKAEKECKQSETELEEARARLRKAQHRNARLDEIITERKAIESTIMVRYNRSSDLCQKLFAQRMSTVIEAYVTDTDMSSEEGHMMFLEAVAFLED